MNEYMSKGKATHRKERTINSDYDIVSQYQSEFRGFAQYYLLAYNAHKLHKVKRIMGLSLVFTLTNKHKTTSRKILKKYKATIDTKDGSYKVLQVIEQRENRKPLIAYFGGIKLAYKRNATITETPTKVFTLRSQLIDRLKNNECE